MSDYWALLLEDLDRRASDLKTTADVLRRLRPLAAGAAGPSKIASDFLAVATHRELPEIERVARAIYASYEFSKTWEQNPKHHEHTKRAAVAAIAAMTTPTQA